MQRILGLALLSTWPLFGCATLYPNAFHMRYGKVQGHDVSIGHFEATPGDGYFLLLSREAESWKVDMIDAYSMQVPPGGERIFFRDERDGRVAITIAFDGHATFMDPNASHYVCDGPPPDPAKVYTPCHSEFTDDAFGARKRGIDREQLISVLEKAGAFEVFDQKLASMEEHRQRVADTFYLHQRIDLQVSAVDNEPGLIDITPEHIKAIAKLEGPTAARGEAAQVKLSFKPLERSTAAGVVRCELRPTAPEHAVPDRGPEDRPVVATGVVVDRCAALHPRPAVFVASDSTLRAEIAELDATSGKAFITVSNLSKEFVRISMSSVEYFGQVASAQQNIELPPNAKERLYMPAQLDPQGSILEGATKQNAREKAIRFGIAIKYQQGSKGEATLYRAETFSLAELIGPMPAQ